MADTAPSSTSTMSDDNNNNNNTTHNDMGESDAVFHDLLNFLKSPRADLRRAAAEATLAAVSCTKEEGDGNNNDDNDDEDEDDGKERLDHASTDNEAAQRLTSLNVIHPLCKLASIASIEHGSLQALAALAVLCSHDLVGNQCVIDFLDARGIGRMLEIALSSPPTPPSTAASVSGGEDSKLQREWKIWRQQVNYACALLANATRTEQGAVDFIGMAFPEEAIPSSRGASAAGEGLKKKDTKPTATLLLSRFLNAAFIDVSSPGYKASLKAVHSHGHHQSDNNNNNNNTNNLDEYDSDFEEEKGEHPDPHHSDNELQPQKEDPMGEEYYDPYQHVAAVIMNITQLDTGRNFLTKLIHSSNNKSAAVNNTNNSSNNNDTTSSSHLHALLPQLNSPNLHRRQGIAGTLKNCCFSKDSIWWLLNVVHIDKALLMTLAGPEELSIDEKIGLDPDYWLLGPQKVRETDPLVRLYAVEAILLLLASGRRSRETLRERRTYVIIKLADMVEENEEVSERMLECVQYLRRDEDGEEEGSSDRRAYERYAAGMLASDAAKSSGLKALPPSSSNGGHGGREGREGDDYDNID